MSVVLSVLAWGLLIVAGLSLTQFFREGAAKIKHLHQIPCSDCVFFTRQACLKCSVHPMWAATETAINCPDFERLSENDIVPTA